MPQPPDYLEFIIPLLAGIALYIWRQVGKPNPFTLTSPPIISNNDNESFDKILNLLVEEREARRIFEHRRDEERAKMIQDIEQVRRELTACLEGRLAHKPTHRLTPEKRERIKRATGTVSEIARREGCSVSTVRRIKAS